jgi:hypothetical protein
MKKERKEHVKTWLMMMMMVVVWGQGQWQGYKASGRTFHCRLVILMPWDAQSRLFAGEKIYLDSDDVFRQHRS